MATGDRSPIHHRGKDATQCGTIGCCSISRGPVGPAPPCRRGRALARRAFDLDSLWSWVSRMRRLHSWTLQEPEIEGREHQDNSDVYCQPLQELVPEEQDVYADHNGYQRVHVKHGGCLSSHRSFLVCI